MNGSGGAGYDFSAKRPAIHHIPLVPSVSEAINDDPGTGFPGRKPEFVENAGGPGKIH